MLAAVGACAIADVLNGYGALVGGLLEVGLEGQVVVEGLHVCGQHLTRLLDGYGGAFVLCAEVSAHVAAVGAVSELEGAGGSWAEGECSARGGLC